MCVTDARARRHRSPAYEALDDESPEVRARLAKKLRALAEEISDVDPVRCDALDSVARILEGR